MPNSDASLHRPFLELVRTRTLVIRAAWWRTDYDDSAAWSEQKSESGITGDSVSYMTIGFIFFEICKT